MGIRKKLFGGRFTAAFLALAWIPVLTFSVSRTAASAATTEDSAYALSSAPVTEKSLGGTVIGVPVNHAIAVTTQPESQTVPVGNTATFTVKATGVTTYQWQYRKNSSAAWANSGQSGNKTATLSVATTAGLHGYQFRCLMSDASGQPKYSSIATLSIRPKITVWPQDTTAAAGSKAVFRLEATGKETLTYQWQYRRNASDEWKTSGQSGNTTATLSVSTTASLNGYQFRCYVKDGNGMKSYTNTVTLTVKPGITKQPADKAASPGTKATFTVTAAGVAPLSYQWQYMSPSMTTWASSGQDGNKTATLSVSTTKALQGYRFRCVVTDGNGLKAYSKAVTLTLCNIPINATYFPDEIFREYIASRLDTDKDGKLSAGEIESVDDINLTSKGVSNIKGIEFFTKVTGLSCANSYVTSVDLSRNTALQRFYCYENNLTSLDVSRNTELTLLSCYGNSLTSLDLSKNTKLTSLYCYNNNLTSIDVSKNTMLTILHCHGNNLASIDVSKNTALTEFRCHDNNLSSLTVSKNTALNFFTYSKNNLTALDVSKNTALTHLSCHDNKLTKLDLSKNTALVNLYCYRNNLTALDVSKNTALQILSCFDNKLTSVNVSKNTALKELYCYKNELTALDVSKNTALTILSCRDTGIASLNVSNNTALTELYCNNTNLTALDVSKNTALTYLNCAGNKLGALDVSRNTALKELYCFRCNLTVLDVSKNTKLTKISCFSNNLSALDLSRNPALTYLYCGANKLTSLDVSMNKALKTISCYNNRLTVLNVSRNKSLTELYCYTNKLTVLDLSRNTSLKTIICYGNNLTKLDVSMLSGLEQLNCSNNKLTSLVLYPYDNAKAIVDCSGNSLSTIDLSDRKLYSFDCSNNKLSALDLASARVELLYCFGNSISSLVINRDDNETKCCCFVSPGTKVTVQTGEAKIVYVSEN